MLFGLFWVLCPKRGPWALEGRQGYHNVVGQHMGWEAWYWRGSWETGFCELEARVGFSKSSREVG